MQRRLSSYRRDLNASYGNLPKDLKRELKKSLLEEQGYICAYCMKCIQFDKMKIEHWASQYDNPNAELDYDNMLACCEGNEGQAQSLQTCDTRKGNAELKFNPANAAHRISEKIYFLKSGHIKSKDEDFDSQLNDVLNLNSIAQGNRFVTNRKAVIDRLSGELNKKAGLRSKRKIQLLLDRLCAKNNEGQLKEYHGLILQWLVSRINRAS